ncbi:4-hydroxyphenylacetate 3-monooxygenase, reductase component [Neisseriaceae bacterium B1]
MKPDSHDFREAMSYCAAGVHVITTDGKAGRFGITMTAVTAVTDSPPTVLICVNKLAAICEPLLTNTALCINVLSENQQDIAEHFAGMTKLTPAERFEQHIWHRGNMGQLQVEGALAHLHGKVCEHQEIGTHHVFFVELDEIRVSGSLDKALVYFRREFGSVGA